ncbi:MAG: TetR/AcrR family transcriptional regulator [Anaerolineae bacterium]
MKIDSQKTNNPERETRILDAAANLFVHYGYDKTTVSDIAKAAGVSKGAIYLHYDSKDALFEGLLIRETMTYQEHWLDLIGADPKGGTIGSMYKNILYALNASPFMAAMFKQDSRILGSYLRKPDNLFRKQDQSTRFTFVKMMQDAGAMRSDFDPKIIAHIMDMLAYGLVAMDEIKDKSLIPPLDDLIEGIAELMDRALTPQDGGDNEAGKAVVNQIYEMGKAQFEAMRNSS